MRALIFDRPGEIRVDELPTPQPGPGEAVIEVGAASVCASDLRVYRGEKYAKPGVVPGHEFAGRVVALGDGVTDLRLGDGVAVYPIIACGGCDFCRRGLRNRCTSRQTLGYDANGGLAEQVLLPAPLVSQGHAVKLADGADWGRAALTEPTACVLNSLESCRFRAGVSVAVLGAGPMGLAARVTRPSAGRRRDHRGRAGRRTPRGGLGDRGQPGLRRRSRGTEPDSQRRYGRQRLRHRDRVCRPERSHRDRAADRRLSVSSVNLFAGFPPESQRAGRRSMICTTLREVSLTGTQNATPDQFRRTAALLPSLDAVDRIVSHRFALSEADQAYTSRDDDGRAQDRRDAGWLIMMRRDARCADRHR